ncbi:hypothetical protein BDV27DRAFT_155836 [Aspergillus caelatus]|uniref:Uncharacterized protein n=1 Tax=Aspergillus caelatus TaxID=61420 RepID=A0A5N7A9L8_9EURO|nr:uncharacterized protein BDV27DRAFT_155836 [Aspergillus caelatus]KAE8366561.1 hypothetical protein BDV27DRAFT_155836 [Aspergillus caelatus]
MASSDSPLLLPVKLDAFVLNPAVCDGVEADQAKIAPITQPNYSYLRLQPNMLQNDVIRPIELHAAAPHDKNTRIAHLGLVNGDVPDTPQLRKERLGVYLHWMIPRLYRTGAAATGPEADRSRRRRGLTPHLGLHDEPALQMPLFPDTPNRWLVVRRVRQDEPVVPTNANYKPVTAWMVESDWMRTIDEFNDTNDDLWDIEASVSPYLKTGGLDPNEGSTLNQQAEVFIGGREKAADWDAAVSAERKRVDLGILNSSNQLFADYQPHNTNVFSTIDTFQCEDGQYLTQATADYFVLGWHAEERKDPLHLKDPMKRSDRLDALSLALHGADAKHPAEEVKQWLEAEESARVLCHGAMYNVKWDFSKKPTNVPADEAARNFQANEPVAVGTTALDALLAYVRPHQVKDAEDVLAQLGPLLQAQSESIEDRRAAADEVQNYNFARYAGGSKYMFEIDQNHPAAPPSPTAAKLLAKLNESQTLQDSTARQLRQLRWDLFALWWRFSTDKQRQEQTEKYQAETDELRRKIVALEDAVKVQERVIQETKSTIDEDVSIELKEATGPAFSQQQDPSILLGKVQSGWPLDYLDALKVRLATHIDHTDLPEIPETDDYGFRCLPDDTALEKTAALLAREFLRYGSDQTQSYLQESEFTPPLYHEDERDQWKDQQPWFPLFLEWEAEYVHIDYELWDMEEKRTGNDDPKFRYTVKPKPLWDLDITDRRTITGRILLLPQAAFSLRAQLERLYSSTPEEVLDKTGTTEEQRKALLNDVTKLPFISAPLDGFTNHLLTLAEGSHLKPNNRHPGGQPQPLEDAYMYSKDIGIGKSEVAKMGLETDLTPYASLVRLSYTEDNDLPAFKPVTHGQFKLTKLNVFDKFGQAAAVIDPRRNVDAYVCPCIGEYYEPQVYNDGSNDWPNVVDEPRNPGECEFLQMPPSINQPSRLHMNFVTLDEYEERPYWRPVTEWENPIWGWVLVNYVNYGIQFFLPDGTFYREVRVAAPNHPNGSAATDKWLPFEPPCTDEPRQLDRLIDQFTKKEVNQESRKYLLAFMDLITAATLRAKSVPGAYSQCVNSLIGRPLALVNAGISLELGSDAKHGQSTFEDQEFKRLPRTLIPEKGTSVNPPPQYAFPLKLGDKDRSYDGLVGYFRAFDQAEKENALDLGALYTPYPREDTDKFPSEQIHLIGNENFPKLRAFWLDPEEYVAKEDGAAKFTIDRHRQQTAYCFLMDPFSPVNAYSSILPIEPLSLPPWTWESALKRMTAFFHFGPLVVADDVPKYIPSKRLKQNYDLTKEGEESETVAGNNIKLPSLGVAEWSWLQPYPNPDARGNTAVVSPADEDDKAEEVYMALDIGAIDPVPTWEKGPLTAVEGFLQMKRAITAPEV